MTRAHLFLVDDIFDLAQHLEAQRQPGLDASGLLFNHTSTQHVTVRNDLGLGWGFFQHRQEIAGQAHVDLCSNAKTSQAVYDIMAGGAIMQ